MCAVTVRRLVLAALAAALLVAPAASAAPPGTVEALQQTPARERALRAAFLRAYPSLPRPVEGPIGTVELARYTTRVGVVLWALATFSNPATQTTDQPEKLRKLPGKPWRALGDTGGDLAGVPCPVLREWGLAAQSSGCPEGAVG